MRNMNENSMDKLLAQVRWPLPPAGLRERILMAVEDDFSLPPPFMIPLQKAMGSPAWRTALLTLIVGAAFCAGMLTTSEADAGGAPFYTSSGFMLTQLFTGVDG